MLVIYRLTPGLILVCGTNIFYISYIILGYIYIYPSIETYEFTLLKFRHEKLLKESENIGYPLETSDF
uniref:Uncharacterized protein n=1 Tax=Octopus bimaculoides TaxID=37653 RepID=A0A0L8G2K4_OCTBM